METAKTFPTLLLASVTTGTMLCKGTFSDIQEAVSHLMGFPIWTHELLTYGDAAKAEALRQFPDLPDGKSEDWQAVAAAVVARYGDMLSVEAGSGERDTSPLATLQKLRPDAEIVAVVRP